MSLASSPLLLHRGINIISDGLVGFWEMEDETTVKDLSGNENHGTVTGATLVDAPNGKKALFLDGIDDFITIPLIDADFTDMSIVLKYRSGKIDTWSHFLSIYVDGDNFVSMQPSTAGWGFSMWGKIGGGGFQNAHKTDIKDDLYHTVILTFTDGNLPELYIDGLRQTYSRTGSWSYAWLPSVLTIGKKTGTTDEVKGYCEQLRLYNKALSEEERTKIHNRRG